MAVPLDLAPRGWTPFGVILRRLPRFLGASSLHRSRCEFALENDAKQAEARRQGGARHRASYFGSQGSRTATQAFWYLPRPSLRAAAGVRSTPAGFNTFLPNWSLPLL